MVDGSEDDKGRDITLETQCLLVETKDGSHLESNNSDESNWILYTVFLPLIEGGFRACLQCNIHDKLELCIENSDYDTKVISLGGAHGMLAFYQEVTREGVEDGMQFLAAGGAPSKFPLSPTVGLTVGGGGLLVKVVKSMKKIKGGLRFGGEVLRLGLGKR